MKWYIAKLAFHIEINNGVNCSQFDEQLRLIETGTGEDAFIHGMSMDKKEETLFKNEKEQNVRWKFIDVAEVHLLPDLKHGPEIYAITCIDKNLQDYINFIRYKASDLSGRYADGANKKIMDAGSVPVNLQSS